MTHVQETGARKIGSNCGASFRSMCRGY